MNIDIIDTISKNNFKFFIISILLGIICSFSLPPYNIFFLNFIVFPVLFNLIILSKRDKKKLFIAGLSFGFGFFSSSLYWISNSLRFDESFQILIPISIILIPLIISFFYAICFVFLSFFKTNYNISSLVLFALLISLCDYLRGNMFSGFPWNLVAFSIYNFEYSLQLLSIVGTYTFNLLVISLYLSPAIIFLNIDYKIKFISYIFIFLFLMTNNIYGFKKIERFANLNHNNLENKIYIVSPKIELNRYFSGENTINIIRDIIKISNPDKSLQTLFIFPEGILSGINFNDLKNYKNLFYENFSENHKIILGINTEENYKIFNSLILLNNKLEIISQYNKNNLVPFGEYLPLENIISKTGLKKITQGYNSFSSSQKRNTIKIGEYDFLPLICYEIIYTGKLNNKLKNIDFIVNISEDGWFGNSIGPTQHFVHSIYRAIEEGKNIFRSSNNGISAHINPTGVVEKSINSTQSGVIIVEYVKLTDKTLFAKWGNKIFFYFLIIYITFIFFLKKKNL